MCWCFCFLRRYSYYNFEIGVVIYMGIDIFYNVFVFEEKREL